MQKGFTNLIHSADDLTLDVPDAEAVIALFIARAIVDDILPPAFVGRIPEGGHMLPASTLIT